MRRTAHAVVLAVIGVLAVGSMAAAEEIKAPVPAGITLKVIHGYNDPAPGQPCEVGQAPDHCDNQLYGLDLESVDSDGAATGATDWRTSTRVASTPSGRPRGQISRVTRRFPRASSVATLAPTDSATLPADLELERVPLRTAVLAEGSNPNRVRAGLRRKPRAVNSCPDGIF